MKINLAIALLLFFSSTISAQQSDMQMKMGQAEKPATLMSGLGSDYAASMVQREFESAWKNADMKLTIQDLWR
jgi:hypothetical protein